MKQTGAPSRLLLIASVLLAGLPVAFGIIRFVSTGDDARYLWLAAASILGSMLVMVGGRARSGPTRVSLGRASGAVAAGAACAAATAVLLGATAGPGVAVVAIAFGLCTGTGAALAALRQSSAR